MRVLVVVSCLLACSAPQQRSPAREAPARIPQRLADDVVPNEYRLTLKIDPSKPTFRGEVEIDVTVEKRRRRIWIHGRDLSVSAASVNGQPATYVQHTPDGMASLLLEAPVVPGAATLSISYEAPFADDMVGLYRAKGAGAFHAFTQFEPLDARRCFPGFDEPRFKAPFVVAVEAPEDLVVVTNGRLLEDGRVRRFARTKPIPTYTVAFAVGRLDAVDGVVPGNDVRDTPLPFRALALTGRTGKLAFAVKETPAIMTALERYFASPYPYGKLDLLAVLEQPYGAMENVGAVMYREEMIFVDEKTTDEAKEFQLMVTAHELAHMWFGNLVTMSWWNDLWLNEAFAGWMGLRILGEVRPKAQADAQLMEWIGQAVETDRRPSARRIRQPIESPDDVRNALDAITYWKGAALLRMVENWMGPEKFREGLRSYVRKHANEVATHGDLVSALSEAAGRDLSGIFASFLDHAGVPEIEAKIDCSSDPVVRLSQRRYSGLGAGELDGGPWEMPICVRSDLGTSCTSIDSPEATLPLERCPKWIHPNAAGAGYYVFALDDWRPLLERWSQLTLPERITAAWSLDTSFDAGALSAETLLNAHSLLAKDPEIQIVRSAIGQQRFLLDHFSDEDEDDDRIRTWAKAQIADTWKRVGMEPKANEPTKVTRIREKIAAHLVWKLKDEALTKRLAPYGQAIVEGKAFPLGPEMRGPSLYAYLRTGGEDAFDDLVERIFASDDEAERRQLLWSLRVVKDEALRPRILDLSLDPRLRKNEILIALWAHGSGRDGKLWTFVTEHFDELVARLSDTAHVSLPRLGWACDAEVSNRVEAFFEPRVDDLLGARRALAEALEDMRMCAARVEHHRDDVRRYFEERFSQEHVAPSR